jgi:hypothetical protein
MGGLFCWDYNDRISGHRCSVSAGGQRLLTMRLCLACSDPKGLADDGNWAEGECPVQS